ncbi:DUF4062 domain-containing protein [candidate division KSB1 bacterium]|nr:DUF4062 domain-containing protein [candidate division KSB1 bacterium]
MRVFISSTSQDLKEYRMAVRDIMLRLEHLPIMMEYMGAGKNPPKDECIKKVYESDVYVGIFAHRYGYIPPGESISITEIEYQAAVKAKKEIFCFIIDPKFPWPEKNKDFEPRLDRFIKEIRENYTVEFFTTPEDLAVMVNQAISKLETNVMLRWQEKAKKIDGNKKLRLIDDLAAENNQRRLSDQAFKNVTKMIASDFKSINSTTPLQLIDYSGELLQGDLGLDAFVTLANDLAKELSTINTRVQKLKTFIRQFGYIVLISFVIGLIFGVLSYRLDVAGARSKYLAPSNANKMDVVEWLINHKASTNVVMGDFSNPGTIRALTAIRFAHELDPNNPKIIDFFDRILDECRRNTRGSRTPLHIMDYYQKMLTEMYQEVPYSPLKEHADMLQVRASRIADSTSARQGLADLDMKLSNPEISDTTLSNGYKKLLVKYPEFIKADDRAQIKITDLETQFSNYEHQIKIINSDTVTITHKIKSVQNFLENHKRESPEKRLLQEKLVELENLTRNYAIISSDQDFVTCRNVADRQPIGITEAFSPGSVWGWAKIKAPKTENIRFEWYANNQKLRINPASVAPSSGYRIYYSLNYAQNQGKGELRVYNSQNYLIGRKVFQVGDLPVANK